MILNSAATRTELFERQLCVLDKICWTLTRSLDLNPSLDEVLKILHNEAEMKNGLIALKDYEMEHLFISAVHSDSDEVQRAKGAARYQQGEGLVGSILKSQSSLVLPNLANEPRFMDRLELFELSLPFIGVPVKDHKGDVVGVLAAQPTSDPQRFLAEECRFLNMIANLLAQLLRLLGEVEHQQQQLTDERDELRRRVRGKFGFENLMVGHTPTMVRMFEQIRRVSKWDTTVLLRGESGTGKELVASAIHYNSPRAHNSFIRLNCAALPENLLESELFGHEKGAFTGATRTRQGRFEQADKGTLFLDEIGEISPMFQAKLLRVLQEGEFERVGGNKTISVQVRIVAATNRNLEQEVRDGHFREDLYYRLNIMPINLPPLRERIEDVPELVNFLLDKIGKSQGRSLDISNNAVRKLMTHAWPGNVRELENTLERASIMAEEGVIEENDFSFNSAELMGGNYTPMASQVAPHIAPPVAHLPKEESFTEFTDSGDDTDMDERRQVIAALEQAGWVQAKAARLLNMTPRQIAYRIQTMNIEVRKL
ncbi:nif-specific transcriptional activator NifA [uncultured Amphritea sp.]|uniref:nif-specific transcriptional activator NifA n=1 Tax=uncultured Amphritea sp. TaxID=981605 RepID=UPI00261FE1FC|nr:nif-specific transcriptional activator NifA [uncultured Amphritea sp.]